MMSRMTNRRVSAAALLCLGLAACSAASPDPAVMAAAELPVMQLDEASAVRAAEAAARAVAAVDSRRFELAEDIARDVLSWAPRQPRARAVLGLCLLQRASAVSPPDLQLQNTGEGETLRASRLAPTDLVVGRLRAQFLARVEHLSAAAAAAEAVLVQNQRSDDADYVALLALCGEWRYELGEERLARPHLQALTDLRPSDAAAHFRLGICMLRTADNAVDAAAAAKAFARSLELAPGDEDAMLSIGKAHARGAELASGAEREAALEAAAKVFGEAAARFPESAEAAFCEGVALEQLGRSAAAAAGYETALQRDPSHLGAMLDLAQLRLQDPATAAAARELLQRALNRAGADRKALTPPERARIEAFLRPPAAAAGR